MADAVRSPRAALAYPDFRLFQGARVAYVMAQQVQLVAVGYHVYGVTHRTRDLGYVGLAQFLPAAGFSLVTGLVADRFDRRAVVRVCYAAQALCSLSLAWLSWGASPSIPAIYAVLFVVGTARAFGGPAQSALTTHLVPREDFPSAVAIGTFLWQMATIAGPALGGAVVAVLGRVSYVYGLCALLLLGANVCLGRMAVRTGRMESRATSLSTLMAGVRYVFAQRLLLGAISLDLFAVLLGGAVALMPAIARDILHTGAFGLGLLRASPALGASLTASVLAYRPLRRHEGAWMLGCVGLFGLGTVGFGLSTSLGLSLALLFVIGAADMVSVVIRQTLIQLSTPPEMRGRVGAVTQVFVGASNELGEFESGLTADLFGTVPAVVMGGVGTCAVVLLWALGFRQLRAVDRLADVASGPG